MLWDKEKIKSILPHRDPFLFVDEVLEIEGTQKVVAAKYVKPDEAFFKGHFPGRPIMPGVLIVEAMAQACIILYSVCKPEIANTHPDYYLGKIKAEFRAPVFPGDKLILEIHNVKILNYSGIMDAIAYVKEKPVARASLVFGVKKNGQK